MAGAAELNIRLIGTDLASAAFKSATASLGGLKNAVTAPIRGIGALQSGLQNAAQSAAVTGGLLTGAVTAPIAAGFGAAIKKVIDLETNLNVLQAVTGASAAQMAVASARAVQLGADITLPGVTAAKATEAMLELGKAGLSFDNILGATRGTLQLATAGQLSFADAAAITGRALNAFKLSGDQAGRVADLLAAAANASTGDVTDMAFALRQASANAATLGIPIEQVVAAISQLANAGIVGQDAGTSLKTFFIGLTKNTKPAIKAQKELGVSFIDAAGNVKPFPIILRDLNKALAGLPTGKAQKLIQDIFGQDAARAALILGTAGPEAFGEMLTAVTKVGAANDLASARTKGLAGAFENLRNIAETMTTNALLPLLPIFTQVVNLAGDLLKALDGLSPQAKASAAAFVAVVAAAGPLLLIFSGLAGTAAFLLTPFGALVGILAVLAARTAKPIADFDQFKIKLEALLIVVKELVAGNASLRLLAVAIQNLTGIDISAFTGPLITGFTFARNAALTFIGALTGNWAGQASAAIDPVTKAIGVLGLGIRDLALQFMTALPGIIAFGSILAASVVEGVSTLVAWVKSEAVPALVEFGEWFKTEGVPVLAAFGGLLTTIGATIGAVVGPAFGVLRGNIGQIFVAMGPLVEAFNGLLQALRPVADLLGFVFGAIAASLPGLIGQLTGFITTLTGSIELIKALFTGLLEASNAFQRGDMVGVWTALTKAFEGAGAALKKADLGGQQTRAGQAAMLQGQAAFGQQIGLVPNAAVPFGPQPVPGFAGSETPEQTIARVQRMVAETTIAIATFNQQTREASTNVAGWNTVLKNAPADMQTVMAWYLSQV